MTHKTKAEKIAASLRARKSTQIAPVGMPQVTPDNPHQLSRENHREPRGYQKQDFLKTFAITLLVLSLMVLVYVVQLRGYLR